MLFNEGSLLSFAGSTYTRHLPTFYHRKACITPLHHWPAVQPARNSFKMARIFARQSWDEQSENERLMPEEQIRDIFTILMKTKDFTAIPANPSATKTMSVCKDLGRWWNTVGIQRNGIKELFGDAKIMHPATCAQWIKMTNSGVLKSFALIQF